MRHATYILRAHRRITYNILKQNKLTFINNHTNIFETSLEMTIADLQVIGIM